MAMKYEIHQRDYGWYIGTKETPFSYVLCNGEVASSGKEVGQDHPESVWFSTREKAELALTIAKLRGDAL